MKTLKNKVYLLTGLLLLSVTVLVWVAFGWTGRTTVSSAQNGQPTCTNNPAGYFYENWSATRIAYVSGRIQNVGDNATISEVNANGAGNYQPYLGLTSTGGGNPGTNVGIAASIAPTGWTVTGQMCR